MREIKFRVFDTKENKMIEHFHGARIDYALHYWETHKHVSEPMQFTGMRDTNDKDIYEKDILNDRNCCVWLVSFLEGKFIAHSPNNVYDFVNLDDYLFDVVGNIHQHAHLLEQNK